jgi:hypothetical protein
MGGWRRRSGCIRSGRDRMYGVHGKLVSRKSSSSSKTGFLPSRLAMNKRDLHAAVGKAERAFPFPRNIPQNNSRGSKYKQIACLQLSRLWLSNLSF